MTFLGIGFESLRFVKKLRSHQLVCQMSDGKMVLDYRVQGAVCSVQGAVCSVQCAGCSVQCPVCRVQGAVCSVQGAVCSV